MKNLRLQLEADVGAAMATAGAADAHANVAPSGKPEFGDYQANGAMAAAKRLGTKPRELALSTVEALASELVDRADVGGPGFINLHLRDQALIDAIAGPVAAAAPATVERIVIDYSHPNLAKEMHVGHLRSTIIGDALARVFEFLGHTVIRQNHVGDWGTQFGMLIAHLADISAQDVERSDAPHVEQDAEALADLELFYQAASQRFRDDPAFAERARAAVVMLQNGDANARALWKRFIEVSLKHCQAVYDRLNVTLKPADIRAESAYDDAVPGVVQQLADQGLLEESDGAQVVFLNEFRRKDGEPLPIIVKKSDGTSLYATNDLAAVEYRARTLAANRVLYIVDARQSLHLQQVFRLSEVAGFSTPDTSLEHHPFGVMLGKDGKPFKTRSGDTVKLNSLLDEAIERSYVVVTQRSPDVAEAERREIARIIGIAAVKYADLSKHRTSDYLFDWDQMLALEGNTAPYLLYACARIHSLFRNVGIDPAALPDGTVLLTEADERALALGLARLPETLDAVGRECLPHYLCTYLYDIASSFSRFYEHCPIATAPPPVQASRLLLARRTLATLTVGLDLLGIETLERM